LRARGKFPAILRITFLFLLVAHCTTTDRKNSPSINAKKAALGRVLFFDPRLSGDNTMACASCHRPELAFTNGLPVAMGIRRQMGDRNVPTLVNRAASQAQFWDMRAGSLEEQVGMVISSDHEMGSTSLAAVAEKLNGDTFYQKMFHETFKDKATPVNIAAALAAYERTLSAGEAPYDRFLHGEVGAMSGSALRGRDLFFKKFRCDSCHSGDNFTDEKLRVRCYPATGAVSDFVAPPPTNQVKVKTPTLRNLIYTAPYMHTGTLKTLEEVVDFYTPSFQIGADGKPDPSRPVIRVSAKERRDLVEFLKSLSAEKPFQEID
jgi:cytochrome c peroxidase